MKILNAIGRAPNTKNEMRERVILVIGPGLIDLERIRDNQMSANNLDNIRKLYHQIFTITMKSGFADLGVFARGNGRVFMMDNQAMQNDLGRNAEGKDQQH
jgi:hypothetical protein